MASPAEQIKHLLEDNSFPSMVKLDGDWGSGKTYYTEHTLLPELKRISSTKNIIYFSLFGLSSLNDFRDKLISASYLSDKADLNWIEQVKDSALGIFKAFDTDNAGTIGNILKTSSGAIKHALMARLENLIVVLDDLERLNDTKFQEQIIGECLHFAEENKLSFIFVLNSAELNLNNSLLEKAFSGKVKFSHNTEELFKIAFEPYGDLLDFKPQLIRLIEKYELKNLRVLKRVAYKLKYIYSQIKDIPDVDLDVTIAGFAKDLIRISCLHYVKSIKIQDISIILKGLLADTLDELEEELQPDELYIRYSHFNDDEKPTESMIKFACGEINKIDDIHKLGRLILKQDPVDKMLFCQGYFFNDSEFELLLEEFESYIFNNNKNVHINKWFEACDFYAETLIKYSYVDKKLTEFIYEVEKALKDKTFTKDDFHVKREIKNPDLIKHYERCMEEYENKTKKENFETLRLKIKHSWCEVDNKIYKQFSTKPFFHLITSEQWVKFINNWSCRDIGLFSDFITDRYKTTNIHNLVEEKQVLIEIKDSLINKNGTMTPSQKLGVCKMLAEAIEKGIEKLSGTTKTTPIKQS